MKFIAVIGTIASSVAALAAAPVDYVKEIQPLLAQHCYQCHGATQPKHGLRLDTAAFALKGGQNGPAIQRLAGSGCASGPVQMAAEIAARFEVCEPRKAVPSDAAPVTASTGDAGGW